MTDSRTPNDDDTQSPGENWGPPIDVQEWDAAQAADWFFNSFVSPLKRIAKDLEDVLTGKYLDSSIHPWSIEQLHELQRAHVTAEDAARFMENYWIKYYEVEDA